jgi:hypothetical protein
MLLVYGAKFQAAGSGVLEAAADLLQHRGLPRRAGAWLARQDVSGPAMLLFAAVLAAAGWSIYTRTGALLGFALALWSIAAGGAILESALILSRFVASYDSLLLLHVLITPVILIQLGVDWTRSRTMAMA